MAALPALMVEGLTAGDALRRSWRLVQNRWWRTWAFSFVLSLMQTVVVAGPAALATWLVLLVSRFDFGMVQVVRAAMDILLGTVFIPIQLIATALYYLDLRVRREGLDLEMAINNEYPTTPWQVGPTSAATAREATEAQVAGSRVANATVDGYRVKMGVPGEAPYVESSEVVEG